MLKHITKKIIVLVASILIGIYNFIYSRNHKLLQLLVFLIPWAYMLFIFLLFTVGCFRVDPVNELQQVLLLPMNTLQVLNSELVTLEGLFNELEATDLKSKKQNVFGYTVLGLVALFFIMKGLKPEFIWGSANKKGGDLMPTSDMVETRIVPYEPSESLINIIEIPTHEIDTRVVSFQSAESTVSVIDNGTSIDTAGALSIKPGKLIHGVIDDLCLIQKWVAIISGHHHNGTPIHSFSNYGLKSFSNNISSDTQGNAFFARELINKLPEQLDQGFMITHGQQPSLMSIHEVGGWVNTLHEQVSSYSVSDAVTGQEWNKAVLEACKRLHSLAQKIHENPAWVQDEQILLKLDRIYFSSGELYGGLLKAILKDWMESRGTQMEILDLVLRLDQVLNPLY